MSTFFCFFVFFFFLSDKALIKKTDYVVLPVYLVFCSLFYQRSLVEPFYTRLLFDFQPTVPAFMTCDKRLNFLFHPSQVGMGSNIRAQTSDISIRLEEYYRSPPDSWKRYIKYCTLAISDNVFSTKNISSMMFLKSLKLNQPLLPHLLSLQKKNPEVELLHRRFLHLSVHFQFMCRLQVYTSN